MKVLFVCTGNICRSPMGELMFPLFFHDTTIETDSAGTQGLVDSPIDPSSGRLMALDGIDSSGFRSKRLTPQIAMSSDLILCFTERQHKKIVTLAPRVRTRTYPLNDFANLCKYFSENNLLQGTTIEDRLREVMYNTSMVRHMIPQAADIADPYNKDFQAFQTAHDQIGYAIADIAAALEPTRGAHAS
ncbi:protein-tyrosine-phosphatase [Bifidobacterium pseudolongum subsp. globosum]|uniref:Protein-tyrosine-phosphatase n=1 Tax=Bifidobacterium pseudolongum subsp. globosum TaxID=1690 RepID=A0A4Q5B8Q5_9BIFI|nr:low molecular weight phosphatase family protein [Bifidobacterium pseudolongum]RYQ03875.1 protein-tyrosine-phosphatase [Bifidobacterium pseudolongum subsp. globosum]RYQ08745.1 protein-tyrosine-phosphatase [Bifidobacterium pseudolongum subsp. globosum]RYQ12807.1 protein-tyrosine-phosphatase [Bifidobacterium pseudolongum subsp. globosum]RYQ15404.1 protein-tyrosine-phosphatase [Bifidobacterium pseudolongum subsp. globosum]RYQ67441.1 protein-tyrosine-phosphatase [Bifidobacterium pseudolongum sub